MSSYIQSVLNPSEQISYAGKVSIWSLSHLILMGVFCLLVGINASILLFVGAAFFLIAYLRYISTELVITNKRVIAKFGFISRRTVEINLPKIESIQVDQSIFGRMFNYGSLIVSGAGNPQAPIPGISDPIKFRTAFIAAQEASTALAA